MPDPGKLKLYAYAGTYRKSEALIIDVSDTALILVSAPEKVHQPH